MDNGKENANYILIGYILGFIGLGANEGRYE